jgi:hypothetical protein
MGARQKLNEAFIYGSLVLAAIAGYLADSIAVFLLTGTVLIAMSFYTGDIRPGKRGW